MVDTRNDENEMNENATENEIIETENVEKDNGDAFSALSDRMNSIEEMLTNMGSMISTIQKAQESFVAMGGTIREDSRNDSDSDDSDTDLLPLDLLDWNI